MQFNAVNYTIFDIPGYIFFVGIGVTISLSVFIVLNLAKGYGLFTSICILPVVGISTILFARLFGCISGLYSAIGQGRQIDLKTITDTGIVFYGGLIGLVVSYKICIKVIKIDANIVDLVAVVVPLFHAIARIGCFTGGCCFGKKYSGIISVLYTTKIGGEIVTAQRFPVQFIEAIFNLCLFTYLLFLLFDKNWKRNNILCRYLLLYSFGRFFIEFFRGDAIRGLICGISFSQILSVLIILLVITWRVGGNNEKGRVDI